MFEPLIAAWDAFISIPHLALYLSLAWLGYLVWLGGWIILQKREPVATLSWLMGLALLPFVGFLVYAVFGPHRIRRQSRRRHRAKTAQPTPGEAAGHDPFSELARLAQVSTGLPATTAMDVRLLVDGSATYEAIFQAVREARERIHLEYYIFEPDRTGTALRDLLVERARAGVKVRLLLDAVGSVACTRRFFAPLIEAGGEFAWFHPMRVLRVWQRPWVNLRTHRKIVVVDDHIGFTGGINITDDENDALNDDAFRDLHMRIEGDAVHSLQTVFVEDWAYATEDPGFSENFFKSTSTSKTGTTKPGKIAAQVVVSGPDSPWEPIHRLYVSAIHSACRRVWLVTPYFVPGEAAMMALTSAAQGGLDVRLLVPKMSDSKLVTWAARSYFDRLLAAGVCIYEYGPRMLHTKALLVDDEIAMIGTANFDARSFRLNFEVAMLIRNTQITSQLADLIQGDLKQAPQVQNERKRSLWTVRLPEALARLLSPLL